MSEQIPDGLRMAAYRAARDWAAEHRHPQPDDRMVDAVLAAVYPLMRALWAAEHAAASEWALWAARQAFDVAAGGAEQMTVERAEARDRQEDQ